MLQMHFLSYDVSSVADVGGSGGKEIAEPSIEVPGGVGQQ
jgi:hypothetical protein